MKKQDITFRNFIENKKRLILTFLLLIVSISLLGCTKSSGGSLQIQESEPIPITRVPPVVPTATLPLGYDPFPFSLDEVSCQLDSHTFQDFDHWADALIPGISTVDDLSTLINIPEERHPDRTGAWSGSMPDAVYLSFNDGILHSKSDTRTKLSEIIAHYGIPEMIVWKVPRFRYDHASYETILIYPEHKAVFGEGEKVTQFTPITEFSGSIFSTQEFFLDVISIYEDTDFDQYVESVWPCSE